MRAAITGWIAITLTVTDLPLSAAWYRQLLSAQEHRYTDPDGNLRQVTLIEHQLATWNIHRM